MSPFSRALFCGILFFSAFCLFARDIEITVIDGDLEIPLEGARIVSWDGSEFFCDARGRVVVPAPDDRQVIIRVSYPGYEPGRLVVKPGEDRFSLSLTIGGILEARELVIEAKRPEASQTVSGRSVAISGRELARSAETGFVEDVMNAIKLLPGVGYVGGYMAMPSIRGGEPQDITAVFDGFYVERPFHWGGAFSIFDPKMVESAQLSHGVFSTRWGHTISGILDIKSKHPSPDGAELDLAVSTSATNLNLSFPLGKKGGAALMGKVTYWDPFVEIAKIFVEEVRYITTAPYIRSGALSAHYAFSNDLDMSVNGFFGGDGIGAHYEEDPWRADFLYDNKIGFLTAGLNFHTRGSTLIKTRLGAGLLQSDVNADTQSTDRNTITLVDRTVHVQARFDLDHDFGGGFLLAAGLEERYNQWDRSQSIELNNIWINQHWRSDLLNRGLQSAVYTLLEYRPENSRFAAELGLRGNHFFIAGEGFTLQSLPSLDPRVNLDFTVLEESGPVDLLTLSFGTGLFSTMPGGIQNIDSSSGTGFLDTKQSRSWTTLGGTKIDFSGGISFSLEGYFKYVFDRGYNLSDSSPMGGAFSQSTFRFDGESIIWGFDCMLQKSESRFFDGWISYSFINARYRDPQATGSTKNNGGWYYPDFHRFHTLNIIANYKPVKQVQLTSRLSFASGVPLLETVGIEQDPLTGKYSRIQAYSDSSRADFVIPLDIKLSFFNYNPAKKVRREIYLNFENLLTLVYRPAGQKDFDSDTGREVPGMSVASYDLPIPLITFGIKWSY